MTSHAATIAPQFRSVDSLDIRFAAQTREGAPTVLLLSPWPESIFAYLPMWNILSADFSLLAVDLPGFGHSQGRGDLMAPQPMGEFVVRLIETFGLKQPHVVGPDIGTSTLLFAAAKHPDAFASIQIGGGATAFPLQATGLLRQFIDAADLEAYRSIDPGPQIAAAVRSIPGYNAPAEVVEDYVTSYADSRFVDSIEFVRSYPTQLENLNGLLSTIDTPVQIFAASDDPYTPVSDHQQLAQTLRHSKLTLLPHGHNAWEEAPRDYAAAVGSWVAGEYKNA